MIIGRMFAEKMFSEIDNTQEEERLYSTGNDELDELMEMAFCEGYEYAQREFAKKDEDGENHRGLGRAYMLGGAGSMIGRHAGKVKVKKSLEEGKSLDEAEREGTKKAGKVGAIAGAGTLAVAATPAVVAAKKALKTAGVKMTKKNKRIAAAAAGLGAATALGAAATYGSAGAKIGMDKNNRERRRRMEKNKKDE